MTEADIIKGLIKEVLAETNPGTPGVGADAPAAAPLDLNVSGQNFKFSGKEQLETALSQTFADFQKQKAEYEAKIAELAAAQTNTVTGKEKPDQDSFDKEAFIKTFAEDPRKGLTELLNQVVFQGKAPDPAAAIRNNLAETEQIRKGLAVNQFLALHPEFNTAQAGVVVNQIREQAALPFDVPGLEAAYGIAISRGLVPPPPSPAQLAQMQAQAAQQQQYPQQQPGYSPQYSPQPPAYQPPAEQSPFAFNGGMGGPPVMGRGPQGGGVPDWASAAENMSPDQIAQVIARMGGAV